MERRGRPDRRRWDAEAARPLSGEDADGATVAIDPANRVWVAWNSSDGANVRIDARRIAVDGTLGSVRVLSPAGKDSYGPQVAIDSKYRPTVVWRRSTGGNRVEVTRGQPRIPETVIESGPKGPTGDPSPHFSFSSPDIDVEGFECGLDETGFADCASPVVAPGLPDGLHTLRSPRHRRRQRPRRDRDPHLHRRHDAAGDRKNRNPAGGRQLERDPSTPRERSRRSDGRGRRRSSRSATARLSCGFIAAAPSPVRASRRFSSTSPPGTEGSGACSPAAPGFG